MPANRPDAAATDPPPWQVEPKLQITRPDAVQVLWNPAKRVHLKPFLGQDAGLAEAAAQLGVGKPAMSYWLGRLQAVGLLRPWGTRRAGRQQVSTYRCVADKLLVSLRDAPLSSHAAVFDDAAQRWAPQTRVALGQALARQAPWMMLQVAHGGAAGMACDLVPSGPGAPADDFLWYWGRLWLSADERDALRAELDALWERYVALSDKAAKPCPTLLHIVHVPERVRR